MPSFNRVILMGRVADEVGYNHTDKGIGKAHLVLQIHESDDEEDVIGVGFKGPEADKAKAQLREGSIVHIEGKLKSPKNRGESSNIDPYRHLVIAERFTLLGHSTDQDRNNPPTRPTSPVQSQPAKPTSQRVRLPGTDGLRPN